MGRASVFENRKWVPLFAGSAALSWACAFPLIKLGLADFGMAGTDIGGKALFAGAPTRRQRTSVSTPVWWCWQ